MSLSRGLNPYLFALGLLAPLSAATQVSASESKSIAERPLGKQFTWVEYDYTGTEVKRRKEISAFHTNELGQILYYPDGGFDGRDRYQYTVDGLRSIECWNPRETQGYVDEASKFLKGSSGSQIEEAENDFITHRYERVGKYSRELAFGKSSGIEIQRHSTHKEQPGEIYTDTLLYDTDLNMVVYYGAAGYYKRELESISDAEALTPRQITRIKDNCPKFTIAVSGGKSQKLKIKYGEAKTIGRSTFISSEMSRDKYDVLRLPNKSSVLLWKGLYVDVDNVPRDDFFVQQISKKQDFEGPAVRIKSDDADDYLGKIISTYGWTNETVVVVSERWKSSDINAGFELVFSIIDLAEGRIRSIHSVDYERDRDRTSYFVDYAKNDIDKCLRVFVGEVQQRAYKDYRREKIVPYEICGGSSADTTPRVSQLDMVDFSAGTQPLWYELNKNTQTLYMQDGPITRVDYDLKGKIQKKNIFLESVDGFAGILSNGGDVDDVIMWGNDDHSAISFVFKDDASKTVHKINTPTFFETREVVFLNPEVIAFLGKEHMQLFHITGAALTHPKEIDASKRSRRPYHPVYLSDAVFLTWSEQVQGGYQIMYREISAPKKIKSKETVSELVFAGDS